MPKKWEGGGEGGRGQKSVDGDWERKWGLCFIGCPVKSAHILAEQDLKSDTEKNGSWVLVVFRSGLHSVIVGRLLLELGTLPWKLFKKKKKKKKREREEEEKGRLNKKENHLCVSLYKSSVSL